jgi:hypothetical protein
MKTTSLFFMSGLIFGLLTLTSCQSSQKDQLRNKIKKEAEIMSKLLVSKNYEDFLKYMFPPLIDMMGGREKVLEIFKQGLPN